MIIVICGFSDSKEVEDKVNRLIDGAELYQFEDEKLNIDPDFVVINGVDQKNENNLYELLLNTKTAVIANLSDPDVAELLKDLMKESKITCFDFNKNIIDSSDNSAASKAVFQLGIILGIDPEKVLQSVTSKSH